MEQEIIKVRTGTSDEGQIKFEIKNISDFKIILESVKFPKEHKNRFNVSFYSVILCLGRRINCGKDGNDT